MKYDFNKYIQGRINYLRFSNIGITKAERNLIDIIALMALRGDDDNKIINALASKYNKLSSYISENYTKKLKPIEALINYVRTRMYVNHSFGGWIYFDYALPFYILGYARKLKEKHNLNVNIGKFSAFLYALKILGDMYSEWKIIAKEIKEARVKSTNCNNISDLKCFNFLTTRSNDITIVHSSSIVRDLSGLDSGTIAKYYSLLPDLEVAYYKRSSGNNRFPQSAYIAGINKLFEDFKYPRSRNLTFNEIENGRSISDEIIKLWYKYELYTQRGEIGRKFFVHMPLPRAPFIRLQRLKGKMRVYVPAKFAEYKHLFCLLYGNLDIADPFVKKCRDADFTLYNQQILNALKSLGINKQKNRSAFIETWRDNKHFRQIEKSFKSIQELNRAGIYINTERLNELKENPDLENENPDEVRKWADIILEGLQCVKSDKYDNKRVFGYFSSYGANTHRMTCAHVNLHGVLKSLASEVYYAPPGYGLYGLDVSGQDIAITLALAHKVYSGFRQWDNINKSYRDKLQEKERAFFEYYNRQVSPQSQDGYNAPIDEITEKVYRKLVNEGYLTSSEEETRIIISSQLRKTIKPLSYIKFYGGGSRISINQATKGIFYKNAVDENPGLNGEVIFSAFEEAFRETLPGVIEVLKFFRYYNNTINKKTFPSLLGWSTTIIHELDRKSAKSKGAKQYTASISYPVQASGAEFLREWIIAFNRELGKDKLKNQVGIVNAVHDQLLLEAPIRMREKLESRLKKAAGKACEVLGIEKNLIKFGELEIIAENNDNG